MSDTLSLETAEPSLEEIVDAEVFGGGTYHFDYRHRPHHSPIEARDGDSEVMLQGMIVRVPEEPVLVNGLPYGFRVDHARLVHSVNQVRTGTVFNLGRWDPRMLEISLGDSLPAQLDETEEELPPAYPFDRSNCSLNVVVPSEVSQSNTPDEELVAKIEAAANDRLALGLEQIDQMKFQQWGERFRMAGWLAVYAASGIGVEQLSSDIFSMDVTTKAFVAGMSAYLIGIAGIVAKQFYREDKYGDKRQIDTVVRRSYNSAVKRQPHLDEPVISLVPVNRFGRELPRRAVEPML